MQDKLNAIRIEADIELVPKESSLILENKNADLPIEFKMPTIALYDGKIDPNDHIIGVKSTSI